MFSDVEKELQSLKKKNDRLQVLFTVSTNPKQTSAILKSGEKRAILTDDIVNVLQQYSFDGLELDLQFDSKDKLGKTQVSLFVKVGTRQRRKEIEFVKVATKILALCFHLTGRKIEAWTS